MKGVYTSIVCLLLVSSAVAQHNLSFEFTGLKSDNAFQSHKLASYYFCEKDISLDFTELKESSDFHTLTLWIDHQQVEIVLHQNNILAEDYRAVAKTDAGHWLLEKPDAITFSGYVNDKERSSVRFTLYNDKVVGTFKYQGIFYTVEPAHHYLNNSNKAYLIFDEKSLLVDNAPVCKHQSDIEEAVSEAINQKQAGDCYELDIAIAIDNSMVNKHGSIAGAINHTINIMNNVNMNYEYNGSTNFADGIEFKIITHYVSSCDTCDPWSSSLNINQLLTDLTVWSLGNGFGLQYDIGQLWTNRNFNTSAVGLANQASTLVCNGLGTHVLQDWTSSIPLLRTTTSHEIGHNLNASHIGSSGNIMSSIVSNTNNWNTSSQTTINSEILNSISTCVSTCQTSTSCAEIENLVISDIDPTGFTISWDPLVSGTRLIEVFSYPNNNVIDIINTTLNSIDINPPGFTPCKRYGVRVTNYCGSGNDSGKKEIIFESPTSAGCARFKSDKSMLWSGQQISFVDESVNATSWEWDFGDGHTSTLQNPVHTYASSGFYDVTLSVNGGVHELSKSDFVKILPDRQLPYRPIDGGNFDTNIEDFAGDVVIGDKSLFELGVGGNGLPSTSNVWKTGLMDNVGNHENTSALYSPRFDMSIGGSYTLEFDMGMQIFFCNGPMSAQIQYSTDDGASWNRLGSYGDSGTGISGWYDGGPGAPCPLSTLVFPDQTGWAFIGNNEHKSYDISFLAGNDGVIFRFVFKVSSAFSAGYQVDGILVDNFEIKAVLNALAVDQLEFNTHRKSDNVIELDWTSINEIQVNEYVVERSLDNDEYDKIAQIAAHNQYELARYNYVDKDAYVSDCYYRLKIVDQDGSFNYSNIQYVAGKSNYQTNDIKIFPNPVHQNFVYVEIPQKGYYQYKIYNISGALITEGVFENSSEKQLIKMGSLENGVYMVLIQDNSGYSMIHRLVKQ